MCFKPTSLTPNPPPPPRNSTPEDVFIFSLFSRSLCARQCSLPRFLALRSWTSHSNYLVSWHIFIFLPALRLLPHLFYLLAASVSFFPLLDFFHIFVLFFVFAISAGHKQKEESVESVAWRHNERKFIGSFGKIREIYCGGNSVWTFLIFLLPFSQKF